jgi:hypothetical protein
MIRLSCTFLLVILILFEFSSCKNIADVKPTERTTFIKIYEKGNYYAGMTAEPLSDGYLLGGNQIDGLKYSSSITKVDLKGNIVWEKTIDGSSVLTTMPIADGYLVLGDGIQANDTAKNINDQIITQALLTKLDLNGNVVKSKALNDSKNPKTDYSGLGLSLDNSGNIIIIGNKKFASALSDAFVAAFNPTTLDTLWTRSYGLIDRDNVNAKNTFVSSEGQIIWANSALKVNQTQTKSYLSITKSVPNSSPAGSDYLGQTLTNNRLIAEEIQTSFSDYGVIGTFSDTQGKNGNIFFVKVSRSGKFIGNSLLFFDGVTGLIKLAEADLETAPQSASDDVGRAISGAVDGGYLLGGSSATTVQKGNGGLDMILIKIDISGNLAWTKTYGGPGDETINSIRPLSDGGFVITGGTDTNGLSSAFLMRVDKNGEIVN